MARKSEEQERSEKSGCVISENSGCTKYCECELIRLNKSYKTQYNGIWMH